MTHLQKLLTALVHCNLHFGIYSGRNRLTIRLFEWFKGEAEGPIAIMTLAILLIALLVYLRF